MLKVPLPADTEAVLRERARAHGEDVSAYAARLLKEALRAPSADDLLAPFRKQVEDSGATNEELYALGESLREEVWREQQARKARTA